MAGETPKYEREITEILERLDRDEPRNERVKRQARQGVEQRVQRFQRRAANWRGPRLQLGATSGWTWIAMTLGAGVLGLLLRGLSPWLGIICALLMVFLFFSPLLGFFERPPDIDGIKSWRGRPIIDHPQRHILASWRYRWRRWRGGR